MFQKLYYKKVAILGLIVTLLFSCLGIVACKSNNQTTVSYEITWKNNDLHGRTLYK